MLIVVYCVVLRKIGVYLAEKLHYELKNDYKIIYTFIRYDVRYISFVMPLVIIRIYAKSLT